MTIYAAVNSNHYTRGVPRNSDLDHLGNGTHFTPQARDGVKDCLRGPAVPCLASTALLVTAPCIPSPPVAGIVGGVGGASLFFSIVSVVADACGPPIPIRYKPLISDNRHNNNYGALRHQQMERGDPSGHKLVLSCGPDSMAFDVDDDVSLLSDPSISSNQECTIIETHQQEDDDASTLTYVSGESSVSPVQRDTWPSAE